MIDHMHRMIILLGSNIRPEFNIIRTIETLNALLGIERVSSVWETPAIGSDGPNFLNAAVSLESQLSPKVIKQSILRPVESSLGRVRTSDKNAPRTIDLDVVVWGQRTWDKDIWEFAHAAVPVAELVPDLRRNPFHETLIQVAQKLRLETEIVLRPDITQSLRSQVQSGGRMPMRQTVNQSELGYASQNP